jgi:polysaccharide deacetylase family protein (PEP-CTERM system associated)
MGEVMQTKAMNFFTVDVEDWFQAGVMQRYLQLDPSLSKQHRLEDNMQVLLNTLDTYGYTGTFFCLGNLVDQYAPLLQSLAARGHEVASHGMTHTNLTHLDAKSLEWELKESKRLLEETVNQPVVGFRAPNFSITDQAIDALLKAGYLYDSSVFPMTGRKGYGKLQALPMAVEPYTFDNGLREFPLATTEMGPWRIPIAGGAYFRHFPFSWMKNKIEKAADQGYYHMYIHPWEIDQNHPVVENMRWIDYARHYRNLGKMHTRVQELFEQQSFHSIKQHLES